MLSQKKKKEKEKEKEKKPTTAPNKHTVGMRSKGQPIHMAKEPYSSGQRALFLWQKSPIPMAKEPYSYGKTCIP